LDSGTGIRDSFETLDPATLDYRSFQPATLASLEAARSVDDTATRLKRLLTGRDRVGDYLRRTLGATVRYALQISADVAHSATDIDRAMRLGFGWTLGPFEIAALAGADVLGIAPDPASDYGRSQHLTVTGARGSHGVVRTNAGASLVDLGDGVLCVEFHSKLNALGGDAIAMLQAGIAETAANHQALVIANDSDTFSAGANLMLVLLEAQEGNWDEIDAMVRAFQAMTMAIKTSAVPVVAAPVGLTLGGGCEICLHAPHVRAAAETYMGLVEAGVGLLPAGGGTKEMLLRAVDRAGRADPSTFIQPAFETIGFGKVSTSAPDARKLGYLRGSDAMTMNRDRLIEDAKRDALAMAAAGFQPMTPRMSIPVGGADLYATLTLGLHLAHRAGRVTDHETMIGRAIARVLAGGDIPHRAVVSEQALLDLEREAFLRLCGEQKTLERIAHTLKTGKTLRN
jgi:3-hydroxyacyl-CoA dehydrogenase